MEHDEAMRRSAVEKYLLGELPPPERDEFEEHFFDCQECAADLKTTAKFLDQAKMELQRGIIARAEKPVPKKPVPKKSRFSFLWTPAFASPAFAMLLLIIAYQNVALFPRLAGEGQPGNPEILTSVSLIGGNSRGGSIPSVTIGKAQPILLSVDIPVAEQFSSYSCVLVAPSGAIVARVPVSADQAKDTVSIRIPSENWGSGDYKLIVQGNSNPARTEPAELAHYRFTLHNSHRP
jgi:hypothetical protein